MTYYLVRHYPDGIEKTTPYIASGTRQAIEYGQKICREQTEASYAQIRNCTGKVICTLLPPDQPDEKKTLKIVQLDLF